MNGLEVVLLLATVVVGFFATAGAAGADLAMNNRDTRDVQLGGLVGIALATLVAGGLAVLVVAGAYGGGMVPDKLQGNLNPLDLMNGGILPPALASAIMILLAISSFPGGCFSAYIAATSFKTTMPKVNPLVSVGLGTLVSIGLAVSGLAGQVIGVFQVIGASFGPVCGAMAADYLLAGRTWAGPRAGFNPAGWISWIVGFAVGASDLAADLVPALAGLKGMIPVPPVAAMLVGFVLYALLAKLGLESRKLPMSP
jgi:cytosine permease